MMTKITVTIKVNSIEEVGKALEEIEKLRSRLSVTFNIEVAKRGEPYESRHEKERI